MLDWSRCEVIGFGVRRGRWVVWKYKQGHCRSTRVRNDVPLTWRRSNQTSLGDRRAFCPESPHIVPNISLWLGRCQMLIRFPTLQFSARGFEGAVQ